jgi:hypothetical protein
MLAKDLAKVDEESENKAHTRVLDKTHTRKGAKDLTKVPTKTHTGKASTKAPTGTLTKDLAEMDASIRTLTRMLAKDLAEVDASTKTLTRAVAKDLAKADASIKTNTGMLAKDLAGNEATRTLAVKLAKDHDRMVIKTPGGKITKDLGGTDQDPHRDQELRALQGQRGGSRPLVRLPGSPAGRGQAPELPLLRPEPRP